MDSNLGGAQTIKKRLAEGIHPSEVKRKIPELEEKVKNLLLNAGFQEKESLEDISSHVHFLHNKRLPDHSGRPEDYRKPDFCWPLAKIILEVDDTYHEHADQQAKDAERNRIYESFGYEVFLRFGNVGLGIGKRSFRQTDCPS